MYFPCFCILEMKYMTLLQRDRENIELGREEGREEGRNSYACARTLCRASLSGLFFSFDVVSIFPPIYDVQKQGKCIPPLLLYLAL